MLPLRFHPLGKGVRAEGTDQNFDAGLVLVVPSPQSVVHPQDRFQVAEQVLLGQKTVDHAANHRRAPESAADKDLVPDFIVRVAHHLHPDVVDLDGGAVALGGVHSNLEFARQVRELRVKG